MSLYIIKALSTSFLDQEKLQNEAFSYLAAIPPFLESVFGQYCKKSHQTGII
jgi:hypothetical protein